MANTPVNNYRIYIGFTKAPDNDVCNLSLDVSDVLDDHPVFTTPPFTAARKIILTNLTSGTVYNVQARAIGGLTGYCDWSNPSAHIVT